MIRQLKLEFAFQGEVRQILMDVIYSRRKTLGLEVLSSGQVKIRVPNRTKDAVIREFAESRKKWILEKYLLMEKRQKAKESRGIPDYVEHPELEDKYRELAREKIGRLSMNFFAVSASPLISKVKIEPPPWGRYFSYSACVGSLSREG